MKQIIPFKKDLLFKTKVSEITSISLEHNLILKKEDHISGEFYISGDYKMTASSINRENFHFKIPFDIELDDKYNTNTLSIDIDNFYYEVMNNEALQVNIDLYIEGEKKEEEKQEIKQEEKQEIKQEEKQATKEKNMDIQFPLINEINQTITREKEKEESREEEIKAIERPTPPTITLDEEVSKENNFNIFESVDNSDTYVTYHVYIVKEEDTIESIMKKYNVDKEQISLYNTIEEIKPGTKLIIPNSNE